MPKGLILGYQRYLAIPIIIMLANPPLNVNINIGVNKIPLNKLPKKILNKTIIKALLKFNCNNAHNVIKFAQAKLIQGTGFGSVFSKMYKTKLTATKRDI